MTDRRNFIGGSDIGAIVGVSDRRTALEVWEAKLGLAAEPDEKTLRMLRHRARLEAAVLDAFAEDRPDVVLAARNVRATDPREPLFSAQIDAMGILGEEVVVVEAKTAADRMRHQWGESDEEIDGGYIAQVQWQLACSGYQRGFLAAMIGVDGDLRVYEIRRDEGLITFLRSAALEFWSLVCHRTPPAPSRKRPDEVRRILARLVGIPVELSDEGAASLRRVFDLRARIAGLEKKQTIEEHAVYEEVRKAWKLPIDPTVPEPTEDAVLLHKGVPVAVYPLRHRQGIDAKRLREEQPLVWKNYMRESTFRVLAKPPKGRT